MKAIVPWDPEEVDSPLTAMLEVQALVSIAAGIILIRWKDRHLNILSYLLNLVLLKWTCYKLI